MSHLLRTAILADAQHGFVPRRSCLTNLLLTEQGITQIMDAHESVDAVFLDFSKAFHSVNRRLRCVKLRAYGVRRLEVCENGGVSEGPWRLHRLVLELN